MFVCEDDMSQVTHERKTLLQSGHGLDAAIQLMRAAGMDKIDSIRELRSEHGYSLVDAKRMVHLSPVWSDTRHGHDTFHRVAEDIVSKW